MTCTKETLKGWGQAGLTSCWEPRQERRQASPDGVGWHQTSVWGGRRAGREESEWQSLKRKMLALRREDEFLQINCQPKYNENKSSKLKLLKLRTCLKPSVR